MWITSSCNTALTPTAVALGNFDGVHRGHRQVLSPVLPRIGQSGPIEGVSDTQAGSVPRLCPTVVTFNPHPQEFFTGQPRKLLTPHREKVELLGAMGIQQLVLLPFDQELAALTPAKFVERILIEQLQAKQISVGFDFRFGAGRRGDATDLQRIAGTYGIEVTIVPLYRVAGERISSSLIREALQRGDIEAVNQGLGRPYQLEGVVVKGQQLGRTLGFPTANLQVPGEKFLPRFGVYAVQVMLVPGGFDAQSPFPLQMTAVVEVKSPTWMGVMNIGCRPTVAGEQPTLEVHLLDWQGDLYGKTLKVQLQQFLRPEQKFASLEALKAQIERDCTTARAILCPSFS